MGNNEERTYKLQNIDSLETLAGISEDRLIQAHGTVHTGHCMKCKKKYTGSYIKGTYNVGIIH
jgi:NAD-dependent SIR2 family protein deacetylase